VGQVDVDVVQIRGLDLGLSVTYECSAMVVSMTIVRRR
jgi:hypothetical protein